MSLYISCFMISLDWIYTRICTSLACIVCAWEWLKLISHYAMINVVTAIRPSPSRFLWDVGADSLSVAVPAAGSTELSDFEVEVKASAETVRVGEPFNVSCIGPFGPAFHQQWIHLKTQVRCCFPLIPLSLPLIGLFWGLIQNPMWSYLPFSSYCWDVGLRSLLACCNLFHRLGRLQYVCFL